MTIAEYADANPEIDGRLTLPSKPKALRWLVAEPSGFGTIIYTYCEENTGVIVEDLIGGTSVDELRPLMLKERKRWVAIQQKAAREAERKKKASENKSPTTP